MTMEHKPGSILQKIAKSSKTDMIKSRFYGNTIKSKSLLFNARQTSSVQTKQYVSKLTLFVANFLKPEIRND